MGYTVCYHIHILWDILIFSDIYCMLLYSYYIGYIVCFTLNGIYILWYLIHILRNILYVTILIFCVIYRMLPYPYIIWGSDYKLTKRNILIMPSRPSYWLFFVSILEDCDRETSIIYVISYLRFCPSSPHSKSRPWPRLQTNGFKWACSRALHRSLSQCWPAGSMLNLRDPENTTGSCNGICDSQHSSHPSDSYAGWNSTQHHCLRGELCYERSEMVATLLDQTYFSTSSHQWLNENWVRDKSCSKSKRYIFHYINEYILCIYLACVI